MEAAISPIELDDIRSLFAGYPDNVRARLLELRRLILDVATRTPEVGPVVETVKWGQVSLLPERPRVGTTIRIDQVKGDPETVAIFVHCQTDLIETIRERYSGQLRTEGTRAILFYVNEPLPTEIIEEFVAMAFTYHLKRG